ncbi:MAG TPA: YfhO family protein [Longimicrobiales bacterium]|nr:YfhO family protein [Longimicrobiales bacterium]
MAESNKRKTSTSAPPAGGEAVQEASVDAFLSTGVAAAIYFGLALLYFVPALLPGRQFFGTDFFAAGYFFQDFFTHRFASGALPKWVPYVYGGVPVFANPGSAFFPIRFLVGLVLPVKDLLPAIFVVQFFLAGLGMYLLARELGVRPWIAFVAGLTFQFTGLPMSFVYAGHDGRIIVATLAPLYFFFLHRGVRTGRLAPFAGAAATLGLALLSFQIQLAYYLIAAAAAWAVFAMVHLRAWQDRRGFARRLVLGLVSVVFAFALASVNFLPFRDYIARSPRGSAQGRGYAYSVSYSMPPGEIVGLAVPEQYGVDISNPVNGTPRFPAYHGKSPFKLHSEYAGAFVVALLFLGILYERRDRYWWFFAGLTLVALSVAFGRFTPLFRLYYAVMPEFKRFRAPNLTFFLVSTSLTAMAALTMERLARLRAEDAGTRAQGSSAALGLVPWVLGGLLVLTILGASLAGGGATSGPSRAAGWMRFAVFLAAVGIILWLWLTGRLRAPLVAAALSLVVVADLWIIDRRFFYTVPPPEATFAADDVVQYLESQPGVFRVWSPDLQQRGASYRQDDYLMGFRIQQAGGEHGNQLQRWNEYVGAGKVTYVDWHNFARYPVFMNAANVRYVITRAQLQGVPWTEVHRGSAIIYENKAALPRAYLVGAVKVADPPQGALDTMKQAGFDPSRTAVLYQPLDEPLGGNPVQGTASVTDYGPDRLEIHATTNSRALLVVADNYYEGWQARVDGQARPIVRVDHTLRGVVLAPGDHDVVMVFRPHTLYTGFWIYLVGCLALLGYGAALVVLHWLRRRQALAA